MASVPKNELQQFSASILTFYLEKDQPFHRLNPATLAARFSLPVTFVPYLQRTLNALGFICTSDTLSHLEQNPFSFLPALETDHIYLDSRLQEHAHYFDYRFVLTHEISHYLIAHFLPDLSQSPVLESATNYLSSCLLLPGDVLQERIKIPIPCCYFDNACHFLPKEEFYVRSLCRDYGVYRKTLEIRLEDLHLFSYDSIPHFMQRQKKPLITERTVHCA